MSTNQFVQGLTQTLFLVVFLIVVVDAVRRPTRVRFDIALFFGAAALVILRSWLFRLLNIDPGPLLSAFQVTNILLLPYLFLRLVDDVSMVPSAVMRGAEIGLLLSVVALLVWTPPYPDQLIFVLSLYFVTVSLYATAAILREARQARGVTRRRMQAVAFGSGFLGLVILFAGLRAVVPVIDDLPSGIVTGPLTLLTGLSFFLGFATPNVLRNAWQEPELRAFLGRAARLPRLPDTLSIVRELERGAAESIGAPQASIGLWDEEQQVLRFPTAPTGDFTIRSGELIGGRVFASGRPFFSSDAALADPEHALTYLTHGVKAILAAPIIAGERRLGVLTVFATRPSIFVDEDLALVQLLADQAAVILESRALIDEAARVRAREEATRLKDDFLSAAAHDLKTPLTALVIQSQLLERRAVLHPDQPADLQGIRNVIREAERLREFVQDLLDASRVDSPGFAISPEPLDVVQLIHEVGNRLTTGRHPVMINSDGPLEGLFDRSRLTQVVDNLLRNAMKYSPDGGAVQINLWRENNTAHFTVNDHGIGIPPDDLPAVFERFHRGKNVDDKRFQGIGLGLYICRGIIEQHGGTISVESNPNDGTTFHVQLPLDPVPGTPASADGHRTT